MASIHKDPRGKSPFFYCAFTLPNGKRSFRSTKLKDRSAALEFCLRMEGASRKTAERNFPGAAERVMGHCEALRDQVTRDPQKMPRIAYLESIRGVAALQVLLLHFLAAFAPGLVYSLPVGATVAGYIHLSPLYFLYDGYSAVYIFFALSGYVLTRSFERHLAGPSAWPVFSQMLARVIRLGLPALAATLVAATMMSMFGRPNVAAGDLSGSAWFASQRDLDPSILSVIRDGTVNALDFNALAKPDQSLDYRKLFAAVARSPGKIGALIALQKKTRFAAEQLATVLEKITFP